MPKLKTHKGAKKRMKLTKGGKVIYRRAGRRHLLSGKSAKRRRKLRRAGLVSKTQLAKARLLLGG